MKPLERLFRSFLRDRRANVAMMGALSLPPALLLTAIAIDQGALYREKRMLQGATDLAAVVASSLPKEGERLAIEALRRNGIAAQPATLDGAPNGGAATAFVQSGRYVASPAQLPGERFQPDAKPANAVRVTLRRRGTIHFGTAFVEPPTIETTAIARTTNGAAISIGSRLARLDGGIANAVLSDLLGTKLSLSAMDYRALADARIDLLPMLDSLGTRMGISAGTYCEILKTETTPGALADAMAALPQTGNVAATLLRRIAATSKAEPLPLGKLIDLGASLDGAPAGVGRASLQASALQIIQSAAQLSNGSRIATVDLGAALPGILGATLSLALGEPPQPLIGVGEEGAVVRTAQTRLLLDIRLLGAGGPLGASINLPLYLELAYGEAKLSGIACNTGRRKPSRVDLLARPGIAELRIAGVDPRSLNKWSRPPGFSRAKLVALPAVEATGSARIASEGSLAPVAFTRAEIDARATKTIATRQPAASLVASLVGDLDIEVRVLGLGLPLGPGLKPLLSNTLAEAAQPVDALLMGVLDAVGVSLGEADLTYHGGTCGRAVLVH
ncbi:MAG: hypothetical protein INR68_04230 [Methylobacterium mesophilicum]|nr:hypothetical protein [Methylobacterium mesophilicum]